jgi:hypothetical protein
MFGRKYGGVPAWLIMLVAVGGIYLYMRHTGSSLFGGSSSTDTSNTGTDSLDGSGTPGDGGTPSIVYVQQPLGTTPGDNTSNPNHPAHPAGPPATHKATNAQRAAAIMADFRKHGFAYFTNHPNALGWLKLHAPGDYRVVQTAQRTGRPPGASKNPPKQGGNPPRRKPTSKTKVRG